MSNPTAAPFEVLTTAQQATVKHYQDYSVSATWFVGTPAEDGTTEVIALGEGFVWSFLIAPDGECSSSEAPLGEFSTGIEV